MTESLLNLANEIKIKMDKEKKLLDVLENALVKVKDGKFNLAKFGIYTVDESDLENSKKGKSVPELHVSDCVMDFSYYNEQEDVEMITQMIEVNIDFLKNVISSLEVQFNNL